MSESATKLTLNSKSAGYVNGIFWSQLKSTPTVEFVLHLCLIELINRKKTLRDNNLTPLRKVFKRGSIKLLFSPQGTYHRGRPIFNSWSFFYLSKAHCGPHSVTPFIPIFLSLSLFYHQLPPIPVETRAPHLPLGTWRTPRIYNVPPSIFLIKSCMNKSSNEKN